MRASLDDRNGRSTCLDVEVTAALVDGSLPPQEADAARAHMAECDSCTDLVTETLLSVEQADDPSQFPRHPRVPAEGKRASLRLIASVLGAAAVIALVVGL